MVLREQVSALKSAYAQRIKGLQEKTFRYRDMIAALDDDWTNFDYFEGLSLWIEAFGQTAITPYFLGSRQAKSASLLDAFALWLGVGETGLAQNGVPDARRENVTPPYNNIRVLRVINMLPARLRRHGRVMGLRDKLATGAITLGGDGPYFQDEALRDRFSEGNMRLGALFLGTEKDPFL